MFKGGRADVGNVFRRHPNEREVSLRVARLPLEYFVCRLAAHWTVVGPTGIFVVGRPGKDPHAAAEQALSLAHRIRSKLSDVVPWVPFVDVLLVAGDDLHVPCTVVDISSLEMALLSGPRSIDANGVMQLRTHVPRVLNQIEDATPLVDPVIALEAQPLDPA